MKIMTKVAVTALITGSVLSLQAYGAPQSTREQCEAQVSESYQNVDEMKFVSKRHFRGGTRIQYAVSNTDAATGYNTVKLAVCWLGDGNYMAESGSVDDALVADVDRQYEYNLDGPLVEFLTPEY